jgi:hypothetical protein
LSLFEPGDFLPCRAQRNVGSPGDRGGLTSASIGRSPDLDRGA